MTAVDVDMADVLFLDSHPAWTWADLMATPDDVVAALKLLDAKKRQAAPL